MGKSRKHVHRPCPVQQYISRHCSNAIHNSLYRVQEGGPDMASSRPANGAAGNSKDWHECPSFSQGGVEMRENKGT